MASKCRARAECKQAATPVCPIPLRVLAGKPLWRQDRQKLPADTRRVVVLLETGDEAQARLAGQVRVAHPTGGQCQCGPDLVCVVDAVLVLDE